MKNVAEGINEFVTEEDEPILEHLTDVVVEDNIDAFKLHFHFSPNEYFSNTILTKEFKLKLGPSEDDPFNFDGPEIIAMKGMKIDWKSEDKNVTQRRMTRNQKNKKTGTTRTITKTIQTDSFFNFFSHVEWIEDREDMEEQLAETFHADITLGSFFRERLVPRAVLYFTGELGQFDEFDEDMDEEMDDVDDDADSDDDPDFKPSKKALRKATAKQEECKQQ
ncbi:nucleosome assembly protein 1 1-like [Tropilaelaps mercedesae]|uniref:Nucleosome assembly protein 1 1-like n=1 Tax=Tropilaelaps mercedesae TaxID=418985 RepID=A0A1V9XRM5_9ACAR|nr:nucleosome assembly protein 1 1-like [Tropilaelaps mercedesae]